MQDRVKTSFIPKQSLKVERPDSVRGATYGVINTLAAVVLIASILGAVGLFLFEQYTKNSIESKRESLMRARAAFQPETIKELSRLDSRLSVSQTLLDEHLAPSILFDVIERDTLASVRFNTFSYGQLTPNTISVSMDGVAQSFNSVALQSDIFGKSGFFSEVIFEGLNIDTNGNVVFRFSGIVDNNQLRYDSTQLPPNTSLPNEENTLLDTGVEGDADLIPNPESGL